MKSKWSKILVYTTLALLAAFLFFWLHQEYKDEQSALRNERDLRIAKELFNATGMNLNELLAGIRGKETQVAVKLDVGSELSKSILLDTEDSLQQIQSKIKIMYSDSFSKSIQAKLDSTLPSEVSIIYSTKNLPTGADEAIIMEPESSAELHSIIPNNIPYDQTHISKTAIKNIWPQILFALLLFSLMAFGIQLFQKNYKDQQLLLKKKNNLISNIAHELKTPVSTIGVALEAIQDYHVKDNPKKANSYIDLSRKELERLSSSIDQVLQLSKMDANHELYHFENQAILPLCIEVANNLALQIKNKNIQLTINSKNKNLIARLDTAHFKSMLFNLIDNSLKYGKEGGQINLNLTEKKQEIELSITDDGIGIHQQYISQLFERFFRVPNGNQHDVKGYGLGLSYVKEIVDVHKWQIDILSKENSGTTVFIKIPRINV